MAVISIVGTSGVGKSFLVKQLASMECLPAFFEGEEGTIPAEVLADVFSGKDPCDRWRWFHDRYRVTLERARRVSDAGIDCYVDGAVMTEEAILIGEDKKHHKALLAMIGGITHLNSDKIVLLTADEKTLRDMILARGRKSEDAEKALDRSIRIQNEFLRLAKRAENTTVIDRSGLDFMREEDLKSVLSKIRG